MAEHGGDRKSEEWTIQSLALLKMYWQAVNADTRDLLKVIDELAEAKAYSSYPPDCPYGSLSQLLHDTIGVSSREEAEQAYRKKIAEAAQRTTGETLPADGSINPGNASQFAKHTQAARADSNGVGKRTQEKLDRLARDFPPLHEEVKEGRLSVNRASIQAGFVREATLLEKLKSLWRKASHAKWAQGYPR